MKKHPPGKKSLLAIVAIVAIEVFQYLEQDTQPGSQSTQPQPSAHHEVNWSAWSAGEWITVAGTVKRTLADDKEGSRHQRFILAVPEGRTMLVAQNIDLADRVPLKTGDRLSIHGRYETNNRGGVIHWTHHDPDRRIPGGWIEFDGKRFR